MTPQEAMAAVKANPRSAIAWCDLGDALLASGDPAKARASYERALKILPSHVRSHQALQRLQGRADAIASPAEEEALEEMVAPPLTPEPVAPAFAAPWLTGSPEYQPEVPRGANGYAPDNALVERQIQLLEAINQQLDELQRGQRQQVSALKTLADQQSVMLKPSAGAVDELGDPALARVKVANFDMPFMALVGFMVKAAIAAVPASIVLAVFWFCVWFVLTFVFGFGWGLLGLGR